MKEKLTQIELDPLATRVVVGVSLCDLDNGETSDRAWLERLDAVCDSPIVELQAEMDFEFVKSPLVIEKLMDKKIIGVHQPCMGSNLISENPEVVERSLKASIASMEMAQTLFEAKNGEGAVYFVTHLVQQDDWEVLLEEQNMESLRTIRVDAGLGAFCQLVDEYVNRGYGFEMAVEFDLEYPKSPAGIAESKAIASRLMTMYPEVKFVFDVAHWFHNLSVLLPEDRQAEPTPEKLREDLENFEEDFPGKLIIVHLGQAYVSVDGVHETHGVPGLWPNGDLNRFAKHHSMEIPSDFKGRWMDMGANLGVLRDFFMKHGRDTNVVLEVIGPSLTEIEIARQIVVNQISKLNERKLK